jgi:hypothetical protein
MGYADHPGHGGVVDRGVRRTHDQRTKRVGAEDDGGGQRGGGGEGVEQDDHNSSSF